MKRTKARAARKESTSAPALRVLSGGAVKAVTELASAQRVVVPTTDAKGEAMPAWRVARWHLICAAQLLGAEYFNDRSGPRARTFVNARAVVEATSEALREGADHSSLGEMAERAKTWTRIDGGAVRKLSTKLKTTEADALAWMLEKLPKTAPAAIADFIDPLRAPFGEDAEREGRKNLAQTALGCLAAQHHAGAAKILHRWDAPEPGRYLSSTKYWEDVAWLADEIDALLLQHEAATTGDAFARSLTARMYHRLGLGKPFQAEKRNARRLRQ
jgi:hypothetical protein